MTISNSTNGSLDPALLQSLQQRNQTRGIGEQVSTTLPPKAKTIPTRDIVSLSGQEAGNQRSPSSGFQSGQNNGTQLVSEEIQELDNGFRRTQEFENADGKKFTRIEEVTTEETRSKRLVLQQNESGSTTSLENIIDQQEDGSLRLVQRFTDETGETKANVKLDYTPTENDILIGGAPLSAPQANSSFNTAPRGTQLDVRA